MSPKQCEVPECVHHNRFEKIFVEILIFLSLKKCESECECEHHNGCRRKIFVGIVIFLFIVMSTILIIWAVLRPSEPSFVLQDVTVLAFNASVPNFLTTNFQVTLVSRNPNPRIGVYYDSLNTHVDYRNQEVTCRTAIPPLYQGHEEVNVWSPFVYGNNVPVSPYNFVGLCQDQSNGNILVTIKIDGRVRWKVWAFISGSYHIHVRCPAYINWGSRSSASAVEGNAVKYQLVKRCSVIV